MSNRGKNPKSLKNIRQPNPEGLYTSQGVRLTADLETVNFWESLTTKERGEIVKNARFRATHTS